MPDTSPRLVPSCKVTVDGSPLDTPVAASLVRLSVDLDADLFAQTTLLFADPHMKLINSDTFGCGAALTVKLGYGANLEQVFDGEVVRLEPQFRKDQPISLAVICQEPLHRLALSQSTRSLNDVDVKDIVSQIAQEHGFSSDAPSGTKQHMLQGNVSNATMLRRLSTRLGMQVRVEGKKLVMGPPPSTDSIPLLMQDGIRKVKVKVKSQGQVSEVTVHGWDAKNKQAVSGSAKPQGASQQGATDHGDDAVISDTSGDNLPPDQSTAEAMAKGRMGKIAEGFTKSQTDMIGDARMVPGQKFDFDKMGPGIDGTWRIERALHEFSRRGYFVKMEAVWISAKKPAPPAPPDKKADDKPADDGKLIRPRWKRRAGDSSAPNDTADMAVDASASLEGKSIKFVLETKADGTWKQVAEGQGTVSSGTATATANLDALDASDFTNPKWTAAKSSAHTHGDSGEVSMDAKAKEGTEVRVILEQQNGNSWDRIAQKISSVKSGQVKAQFTLEHPFEAEAGKPDDKILKVPTWTSKPEKHGSSGSIQVRAPGLADGRVVRFDVERKGADGKWSLVRSVQGKVERGTATAALPDMRHPANNVQPDHADVLANPSWEKGDLAHGDVGKFSVSAPNLDGRVVAFIVERSDGAAWTQLVKTMATVASGKAQANARLAHPVALTHKPQLGVDGAALTNPRWDKQSGKHGEDRRAIVDAKNLEGATIEFIAERKEVGGWVEMARGRGEVKDGKASAPMAITHPLTGVPAPSSKGAPAQTAAPKLSNPRWDSASFAHGDVAVAKIDAQGLEGSTIQFIAERLEEGGWVEAGRATGKASGGAATANIAIQHPGTDNSLRKFRFRASVLSNPDDALDVPLVAKYDPKTGVVTADTGGDHENRVVRFILESRKANGWTTIATSTARASKGSASGKLPVSPTAAAGQLGQPRWGANSIGHGEDAQLVVDAKGLDGKKVKFVVEQQMKNGSWTGVGTDTAVVKGGQARGTVKVSHPNAAQSAARLANPRWDKQSFTHGDAATAIIDAPGLDGATIQFIAERMDGSKWVEAARATGVAANGQAKATMSITHPLTDNSLRKFRFRASILKPAPAGSDPLAPAKLRFSAALVGQAETRARAELMPDTDPRQIRFRCSVVDDPNDGDDADLPVQLDPKTGIATAAVEGAAADRMIKFVLEEQQAAGWKTLSSATGRVAKGVAKVTLPVHHETGAKLANPRWAKKALLHGDQAELVVDAKGLDGHRVKFTIERFDGKSWSEVGNTLATVKGGKANGSVTVLHPAGSTVSMSKLRFRCAIADKTVTRVRAQMLPDLDSKKLRFRAELVPDYTQQTLRFSATPVPDLLPKKMRFRGELPVPLDPALTRLKCSVVGGGADDVQTGGPNPS